MVLLVLSDKENVTGFQKSKSSFLTNFVVSGRKRSNGHTIQEAHRDYLSMMASVVARSEPS